jgi:NADH-quinone oxidoreductase subunit E
MPEINSILQKYPTDQPGNLIPLLAEIHEYVGFLSTEAIKKVGEHLKIPTSRIYGLATFYNDFRFQPRGKYHFQVCSGTSCHINLNTVILKEICKMLEIKEGEVTKNGLFSIEKKGCMCLCNNGPVMTVNEKAYFNLTIDKVHEIIHFYMQIENQ